MNRKVTFELQYNVPGAGLYEVACATVKVEGDLADGESVAGWYQNEWMRMYDYFMKQFPSVVAIGQAHIGEPTARGNGSVPTPSVTTNSPPSFAGVTGADNGRFRLSQYSDRPIKEADRSAKKWHWWLERFGQGRIIPNTNNVSKRILQLRWNDNSKHAGVSIYEGSFWFTELTEKLSHLEMQWADLPGGGVELLRQVHGSKSYTSPQDNNEYPRVEIQAARFPEDESDWGDVAKFGCVWDEQSEAYLAHPDTPDHDGSQVDSVDLSELFDKYSNDNGTRKPAPNTSAPAFGGGTTEDLPF